VGSKGVAPAAGSIDGALGDFYHYSMKMMLCIGLFGLKFLLQNISDDTGSRTLKRTSL